MGFQFASFPPAVRLNDLRSIESNALEGVNCDEDDTTVGVYAVLGISISDGMQHFQGSICAPNQPIQGGHTRGLVEMRQGSQIVGRLKQWGISEWWQTVLALLDLLPSRVNRDLLQIQLSNVCLHAYSGVLTLPRSSMKTSFMLSLSAFVTEATSADTQACSLSSNHTRVPLLYIFSAMRLAQQGRGNMESAASCAFVGKTLIVVPVWLAI